MIATVLSMVLGLGVTRLLLGAVNIFRTRAKCAPDWLTITWALIIFAHMLEFWWAINHLALVRTGFTYVDFVFLVVLTLLLFLAAALVLPSRAEDEEGSVRAFFERDGRYGLLALAAFYVLGFVANVHYFGSSPSELWAILDIPIIVVPIVVFLATARRIRVWLTVLYVPLNAVDYWVSLTTG